MVNVKKTKRISKPNKAKSAAVRQPSTMQKPGNYPKPKPPTLKRSDIQAVCSNIDPFCVHASGAKIYDNSNQQSMTHQSVYFNTALAVNAQGFSTLQLSSSPSQGMRWASTFTGNAAATWTAWSPTPEYGNMTSYFTDYRVVSYGVRIFGMTNATQSAGIVTVGTTTGLDTSVASSNQFVDSVRVSLADCDVHWTGKFNGTSQEFIPIGSLNPDWDVCNIMVTNATNTILPLGVELIINYELIPIWDTLMVSMATPPHPANPILATAIANARSYGTQIMNAGTEIVSKRLQDMAKNSLMAVGNYYTGGQMTNLLRLTN